jgi:hypothetical protein
MLEKEPQQRFDINQVDEAIKRINTKSASVDLMKNRYEVVRKLGEGTEAEVYLVSDTKAHNME